MLCVLRVAIVGCGPIGNTHARQYVANPDCTLVAVCDIRRDRAEATAAKTGARAYFDLAEMLRSEDIDAVSVCTAGTENGGDHYVPARQCLEAGKHVLVEKPLCNELAPAKELVRLAAERGLLLGVDLNHRYVPPADRALAWVREGRIGEPVLCNMELWIDNPNETSPWFHLRALHSHSIDVMRFFCGDVRRVQAFLGHSSKRTIWSNCVINLEFESGCLGALFGSYEAAPRHGIERLELLGNAGRIVLDNVFERLELYPHGGDEVVTVRAGMMGGGPHSFEDTFRHRLRQWVADVSAGGPVSGSGEEGLKALAVVEAAIISFNQRRIVELSELLPE